MMDNVITLSTATLLFAVILPYSIYSPIAFAVLVRNYTDIAARMDMVVILSQKKNPSAYDQYQERGYAALHESHLLRIGDEWTKVAIVAGSGKGDVKPRIVMNLTGDGILFGKTLEHWEKERQEKREKDHVLKLAEAFDLIRAEIFSTKAPSRAKVVFFMMTSAPEHGQDMDTVMAAKELRKEGALLYMMVKEEGKHSSDRYVAMNYTDDPKRVIVYKGYYFFDNLPLAVELISELTSNALYTDLCQWNHKCQCNQTQGVCNETYVLPYLVGPIDEGCRQSMPTAHIGNCTLGTTIKTTPEAMIGTMTGITDQPTITTTSALTPAEIFGFSASALFFVIQVTVAIALCTCFR